MVNLRNIKLKRIRNKILETATGPVDRLRICQN
jgi:hypothetical protein